MKRTALQNAEYFAARRRRRSTWRRGIICLAAIVALSTVLLLMRPATTLETPQCGLEEHAHSAACYTQRTQETRLELVCGLEEGQSVAEPEEPVEPAEPTEPTEPTEPVEPVEPTEPTEPVELVEPIAPVEPAEPAEPMSAPLTTDAPTDETPDEDAPADETPGEDAPHVHTDACYAAVTVPLDTTALTCPLEESETHTHSFLCYGTWDLTCPLSEHTHTDACRTGLSEEEQAQVDALIARIDALPTDEELSDTIDALADDPEALSAWYTALRAELAALQAECDAMTPAQRAAVTNAERLEALGALCSAETLTENFHFDKPTEAGYASTKDFIELNLYDYNKQVNDKYNSDKKYPGFQWNGGAYMYSDKFNRHYVDYIDFGNSNITDIGYGGTSSASGKTNGYSQNRVQVGVLYTNGSAVNTGAINRLWWDGSKDITNRPVGMSTGVEALSRTLVNGYPALTDGSSLAYLFTSSDAVTKKNTESIEGLFQQDATGAYYYNSRWNHAQYSDNQFTLYDQIITPNFIVYPFGNFLPFNTITDSTKATQVSSINGSSGTTVSDYVQKIQNDLTGNSSYNSSPTRQQLNTMLEKYQTSINGDGIKSSKAAIVDYFTAGGGSGDKPSSDTRPITDALLQKMYNIDWDEETNFFFGMEMKMNFLQPKDGLTGNDGKQPMVFYFTGDDDVWVYIDGVLFLDLTGIHRHVGGEIDFVNGKVYYYALDTENGGDVSDTPYKTYTFAELLTAAGKSTDGLNEKGAFEDYSTHSFRFFYMERGSGSSVCRMNFNFPLLRKNSISVSKELSVDDESKLPLLGNPDFKFQVLKEGGTELFIAAGTTYEIQNAAGETIGTGKVGADGVFTLKAGQTAVFSGIKEDAGRYFVRELLDENVFAQYGEVSVNGSSVTKNPYTDVTIGSEKFTGLNSPVKDMSDGSTAFRFDNNVATKNLGSLSITKQLETYPPSRAALQFDFAVELDGTLLPEGTAYTVGGEMRTVTTEGIITLAPGETALLSNILAGTQFTVTETTASAKGYTVSYIVGETTSGDRASGTVGVASKVAITVKNAEKGASAEIPVQKTLLAPDGAAHNFHFALTQVTNSGGETAVDPLYTQTLTLTLNGESPGEANGRFTLDYALNDLNELPQTFYYRITEVDDKETNMIYDTSVYVVEITVSDANGAPRAAPTKIWKDGTLLTTETAVGTVAFTNRIYRCELPATGGAGTHVFMAAGLLLCAAAALGLCSGRKRRREAAS